MNRDKINEIISSLESIGIYFKNTDLLVQALTHPTYALENKKQKLFHNQRLEFLGDAVLGLVMGEHLYQAYPDKPEGELTKMRAALVCESSIAEWAKGINLGRYLFLGRGEELSGGREKNSILADAFEAVIGSIYLECGLEGAKKFLIEQFAPTIDGLNANDFGNYKAMLQEFIQKYDDEGITYFILEESGPDHQKQFLTGVQYRAHILARGLGSNKKEAEQKAAQAALDSIEKWRHLLTEKKQ